MLIRATDITHALGLDWHPVTVISFYAEGEATASMSRWQKNCECFGAGAKVKHDDKVVDEMGDVQRTKSLVRRVHKCAEALQSGGGSEVDEPNRWNRLVTARLTLPPLSFCTHSAGAAQHS